MYVIITLTEDGPFQPTIAIGGPYNSNHRLIILEPWKLDLEQKLKDIKLER